MFVAWLLARSAPLHAAATPCADDNMFEFYGGGTWPVSSCPLPAGRPDGTQARVNHALLVVGYHMQGPKENHHWIVKNSWGGSVVQWACLLGGMVHARRPAIWVNACQAAVTSRNPCGSA